MFRLQCYKYTGYGSCSARNISTGPGTRRLMLQVSLAIGHISLVFEWEGRWSMVGRSGAGRKTWPGVGPPDPMLLVLKSLTQNSSLCISKITSANWIWSIVTPAHDLEEGDFCSLVPRRPPVALAVPLDAEDSLFGTSVSSGVAGLILDCCTTVTSCLAKQPRSFFELRRSIKWFLAHNSF